MRNRALNDGGKEMHLIAILVRRKMCNRTSDNDASAIRRLPFAAEKVSKSERQSVERFVLLSK